MALDPSFRCDDTNKNNMTKNYKNKIKGMTLIETLIFIVLLSMLMANTINYLYNIQINNLKLIDDVESNQKGFIATTALILLVTGTLAFLVATLSAVTIYADSVYSREIRIQKQLNEEACQETLPLLIAKDYFLSGNVTLDDFGCVIHR